MILLALDTSGPTAGVALMQDGEICYAAMARNHFTHSESMMPMVEQSFLFTGLSIDQVDYFAVTVGPGSFTGVRIGVTAVKAMCHARPGSMCIAVDALEAFADTARYFDGYVCPIQDARAGQVYGAVFEDGKRIAEDAPQKIEDYCTEVQKSGKPCLFIGDGMPVHRKKIAEQMGALAVFAPANLNYLHPETVAQIASCRLSSAVDYLALQPLYLRAPQAERQKNLRELGHE